MFKLSKNVKLNVPPNVDLVRGWFIDTLDIFYLLGSRLVRGSMIIFDELINYPQFDKHELKVLFEYMSTHATFRVRLIAAAAPMVMNPTKDVSHQSMAFIVV